MQESVATAQLGDDPVPMAEIGRHMCLALDRGNAVVCIAIGARRQLLEEQLADHGVNLVEALGTGTYLPLDASETLSSIIIDGSPDVIRFAEVIGAPVDLAAEQHGCVLIFGELIQLLHAQRKHSGADELEVLWWSFMTSRSVFVALPPKREHGSFPNRRG